jgi:hypothetical protein
MLAWEFEAVRRPGISRDDPEDVLGTLMKLGFTTLSSSDDASPFVEPSWQKRREWRQARVSRLASVSVL